jgi:CheY-like chemotaxis protein
MPLILAIENNRTQIAGLTSIVRGVGAELILAESAAHAIKSLANRIPDLILIPPLLSSQDDRALTNRLRELGTAAAHVRTLSIPILATSRAKPRGKLSMLRKSKEDPAGCAPEVFRGQLAEYLECAAGERERAAASTWRSKVAGGAVREANAAGDCGGEEVAEPSSAQQPCAPADTYTGAVDARAGEEQRMIAEATRAAVHARVAEERRAGKAAAEAKAAEERLAVVKAALAAAEAKAIDEQRAAGEAARIATEARIVEEQRAARATAEATAAEERRANAAAEALAAEQRRGAAESAMAATAEARVAEEQRAARATAEATAAEERCATVAAETRRAAGEVAQDEPSGDGPPRPLPESEPTVARKTRKKKRRRDGQATDAASFFDPQEVTFATLVGQLDEITGTGRPRRRSGRADN